MKIEYRSGTGFCTELRSAACPTAKEAVAHAAKSGTTAGFSINYAVNPATLEVVEVFKSGKPCQRDVKPLIAAGFTVWAYSWAFAPKTLWIDGQECPVQKLDLTTHNDIAPWARAFGYAG